MANALYDFGRDAFLKGQINWSADTFKVALLSNAYTVNLATHQYASSLAGIVATSSALITSTPGAGVAGASNVTFATVTGSQITQFVIYKDTGSAATSPLVAYFDTATNLPITPNGGSINLQWDVGSLRIFKL